MIGDVVGRSGWRVQAAVAGIGSAMR